MVYSMYKTKKRKAASGLAVDEQKAARLTSLQSCSVSQAAHVALALSKPDLVKNDLEYQQGWWQIKNKSKAVTKGLKSSLLHELKLPGGQNSSIHIAKLPDLLQWFCETSSSFAASLQDAIGRGDEPLRLLVYWDETTPANALNPVNNRKSHLLYASVLEFKTKLQDELHWWPLAVVKTDTVSQGPCSLSEITRLIFHHWLEASVGVLHPSGFPVKINGSPVLVRFTLEHMITDEAAMKSIICSKGAAGMKPCSRCANIISKYHGHKFDLVAADYTKDITESDPKLFIRQTDADIFHILNVLEHAHQTSPAYEVDELEKVYGWRWQEGQLLCDPVTRSLLPPSKCLYDFLHVLFSNGTVSLEICLFWSKVEKHTALTLNDLQTFACGGYGFRKACHRSPSQLRRLFDTRLMHKNVYGGDAGQAVIVLLILEIFARKVLSNVAMLAPYIQSLLALCDLSRWYWRLKFGSFNHAIDGPATMTPKVSKHLRLFQDAYGKENVRPKHHFCFHCAEQIGKQILDCFTLERKHRIFKDAARAYASNDSFEASILTKLLLVQREGLRNLRHGTYLEPCRPAPTLAKDFQFSEVLKGTKLSGHGCSLNSGDIFVWVHEDCGGQVKDCLLARKTNNAAQEAFLLISDLVLVKKSDDDPWHLSEWRFTGSESLVRFNAYKDRWHMLLSKKNTCFR